MKYPTKEDRKPGLWVMLNNGHVIGPIIHTEFSDIGVYVWFGPKKTDTYQVITRDMPDYKLGGLFRGSPRLVNRVGTKQELARVLLRSRR